MGLENLINYAKNFIKASALSSLLVFTPLTTKPCSGYNIEKTEFSVDFTARHEPKLIKCVSNIPQEIRTIPDNKDDYRNYPDVIINENSACLRDRIAFGGRFGLKLHYESGTRLLLGLGLDLILNERQADTKKIEYKDLEKISKNNTNSKTLCGGPPAISGVYWNLSNAYLSKDNKWLRPSIYLEINRKLSDKSRIGFGFDIWHEKIIAENGYTKGNEFEKSSRYNLADMLNGSAYITLKILSDEFEDNKTTYALDFGVSGILSKKMSSLAKDIELQYNNPTWFAGLRVGTSL